MRLLPIVTALAALAALAACASDSSPAAPNAPVAPTRPEVAPEVAPKVAIGPDADKHDTSTIVGKPMPALDVDWMGGEPVTPAALRGQVVLVRWFTEGCPYCAETAPSLVAFHQELAPRGLRVIGMYHHKSDDALVVANVKALASEFGFTFPVAIDRDWKTLRAWWLDQHPGWTSLSFLIDRRGIVRFVHTGGSYAPGSEDAVQMRRWIDQLLAEPADPR